MRGQFTPQWPDGLPVGDAWVPAPQQADIRFPYDGSLVASAPVGDAAIAGRALDHAVAVRDTVGRLPSHVRRAALSGAHRALAERRTELEQLLVLETGKPLVDCRTEVDRTLLTLQTSAEEVARLHGETGAAGPAAQRRGPGRLLGAQAGRRRRRHRRLQLPAAAGRAQGRPGAGCRVPGGAQAGPADPARDPVDGARPARGPGRGGRAGGRRPAGHRRRGRRGAADHGPAAGRRLVHRLRRGRAPDRPRRRPDQGAARARVQRRRRRGRGRRPRCGRRRGDPRRLLRLGPGMHQRAAGHRHRDGARGAGQAARGADRRGRRR